MENRPRPIKPLGMKAYGSIPHLPGSRRGPADIGLDEHQAKILTEKARDKHDIVIVTEKLDGCLFSRTKVRMIDGTMREIKHINIGDVVLGYKDGKIVPSCVLNKFNNGRAEKWLRVVATKNRSGRGATKSVVYCTPNHRFYNPITFQFVEAKDLINGSDVMVVRNKLDLTPIQKSILIGKMLGDGSLAMGRETAMITFGHRKQDCEYVDWTLRGLGEIASPTKDTQLSGYGTVMIRGKTICTSGVLDYFEDFIGVDGKKIVPQRIEHDLDPIALAFWYMDDGSLSTNEAQEDRANFSTEGFDKKSIDVLSRGLKRLGIESKIQLSRGKYSIRLNRDAAERMFLLVAPYILPCMQRKLPVRYRGHSGWLPDGLKAVYQKKTVNQKIISVSDAPKNVRSYRWDIETETHNFFAGDILVHNSCTSVAKIDNEIVALIRAGYLASGSNYTQHHYFAKWVEKNKQRFDNLLTNGERCVGEWLLEAHGTLYNLPHEPFVIFDIMQGHERIEYAEMFRRCTYIDFITPCLICIGEAISIERVLKALDPSSHGAVGGAEGAVWRVERKGKFDFAGKYVKSDKIDGKYLENISGQPTVYNIDPEKL